MNPEYLAGFFDGEGTFALGSQKHKNGNFYSHFTVLLSQSGEDGLKLLELIQKDFGGKIYQHLKAGQYKATKNAYKLYWNREEAIVMIEQILNYLILKYDAAHAVLHYLKRNG